MAWNGLSINQSKSIGESGAFFPAVDDDDAIASLDEGQFFAITDSRLNSVIEILFPAFVPEEIWSPVIHDGMIIR